MHLFNGLVLAYIMLRISIISAVTCAPDFISVYLGTPGPNSTRSSLSALTFLDEPAVPRASISQLKSSFSKSKEADDDVVLPPPKLPAKRGDSKQQPTSSPSKASPNKPLGMCVPANCQHSINSTLVMQISIPHTLTHTHRSLRHLSFPVRGISYAHPSLLFFSGV